MQVEFRRILPAVDPHDGDWTDETITDNEDLTNDAKLTEGADDVDDANFFLW